MSKYKISYNAAGEGPPEVEADRVEHKDNWFIFMDGKEPVLSMRTGDIDRYERTEKSVRQGPFVM